MRAIGLSKVPFHSIRIWLANQSYTVDDGKVEMMVPQGTGIPKAVRDNPTVDYMLDELCTLLDVPIERAINIMINRLPAMTQIPIHQDWIPPTPMQKKDPRIGRYHLVVIAEAPSVWWDKDSGHVRMQQGYWYGPVPYWNKHQVTNSSDSERVHVIVDIDTPEPLGEYEE